MQYNSHIRARSRGGSALLAVRLMNTAHTVVSFNLLLRWEKGVRCVLARSVLTVGDQGTHLVKHKQNIWAKGSNHAYMLHAYARPGDQP